MIKTDCSEWKDSALNFVIIIYIKKHKMMVIFFFFLFLKFYFLTLQYCIGFAIYQNEFSTGIHVFPILSPPPSSLPIFIVEYLKIFWKISGKTLLKYKWEKWMKNKRRGFCIFGFNYCHRTISMIWWVYSSKNARNLPKLLELMAFNLRAKFFSWFF